jgi:serine protease Do
MLRKLTVFIFLSLVGGAAANAQQQNPAPKSPVEKSIQQMVMVAPFSTSYLGVQTRDISKENMAQYNLREVRGVAVEKVSKNSPAAQAGILAGDVILKFDGEEITGVRKLTRLISEVAPDHQARITISRGGSEQEVTATLGKRQMPSFQENSLNWGNLSALPNISGFPRFPTLPDGQINSFGNNGGNALILRGDANRRIGVGVTPLTKQLGEYFGVADGKGLLINDVSENSPAAKAGLKAGDVIVEVDGKQIGATLDLLRVVNEKKEGDVSLTIVRDRNRLTVRVAPEVLKTEQKNLNVLKNLGEGNSE